MNHAPPEGPPLLPQAKPSRRWLRLSIALACLALVALGLAAKFWCLPGRHDNAKAVNPAEAPAAAEESWLDAKDFSASNFVSVVLGEKESGHGLEHLPTERDGVTEIGTVNGVRCRHLNLPQRSGTGAGRQMGYFYFFI